MAIISSVKTVTTENYNTIVPADLPQEKVDEDSKYSETQLELRQQVLLLLFKNFGTGDYSNQSIYECADEWVRKGHATTSGLVSYYKAYYTPK